MTDLTQCNIYAYVWGELEEIQIYGNKDAFMALANALVSGNSDIKLQPAVIDEDLQKWVKRSIDEIETKVCEGRLLIKTDGTKIIMHGEIKYYEILVSVIRQFAENIEDQGHVHVEYHDEGDDFYLHPNSSVLMISDR